MESFEPVCANFNNTLGFSSKLKRKKQVTSEKPVKKQKTGETSRALSSSKQSSSSRDDNMFQVKLAISLDPEELLSGLI